MKTLFKRMSTAAAVAFVALTLGPHLDAQDLPAPDGLNPETRQAVVGQMRKILEQTKVTRLGAKPEVAELVPDPVLNWNDVPRGHHYGTLWVWGSKGRPAAIIEMYTVDFAKQIDRWPGNVLHSLAAEPLKAEAKFAWNWAPRKSGFTPAPLADAPAPAATNNLRKLQMRSLAKRFSARQTWQGESAELRLLPTPVRLYESAEDGVLDGGLFVLSHGGTNPEVVLILEAIRSNGGESWQFGCVRLGHAEMHAQFDGREVWTAPLYESGDPTSAYYWISNP